MKIHRYSAGQTNISLLQQGRAAIRSPEEVAQRVNAPYAAAAHAAGVISGDLTNYVLRKLEQQDKNDRVLAASDSANVSHDLRLMRKQAEIEKWTEEQYTTAVSSRLEQYRENIKGISDRNRTEFSVMYEDQAKRLQAESFVEALDIRTDRTREAFAESYDALGAVDDYEGQLMMIEVADSGEGSDLFTPVQLQQMKRSVEGQIMAEDMMVNYRKARDAGIEDEYLETLVDKEISDETKMAFGAKKKEYDSLTSKTETDLKRQKAIAITLFRESITADTTDEAMIEAFTKSGSTDYGLLNTWFSRRQSLIDEKKVINGGMLDPHNTKDRKALDMAVVESGETIEERFDTALSLSVSLDIAPKWLDAYFNSNAYHQGADFMTAGENYIRYKEMARSVPLGIDSDVVSRFELYRALRIGMDAVKATSMVKGHYDSLNDARIQANETSYFDPAKGPVTGESPADTVFERTEELLKEEASGMLAVQGFFVDTVPDFPPEMEAFIATAGLHSYGETRNVEATSNSLVSSILNSGWRVTEINDGIDSGAIELEAMWMKKPPTRGVDYTRAQLGSQLKGETFLVSKVFRTVNADEVEFWQHTINPENGKDNWILRVDGALIYNTDGGKVAFEYDEPDEIKTPTSDVAVDLVNAAEAAEEERQRAVVKQQFEARKELKLPAFTGRN